MKNRIISDPLMQKCHYRDFIKCNGLNGATLPEPLQNTITKFESIRADLLKEATSKTKWALLRKLKELDLKLLYLIMEYLDDQLENNTLTDAENDESILEDFVNMVVLSSDLRNAGFRGDLSRRVIEVGNYLLERMSPITFKFKVKRNTQNDDTCWGDGIIFLNKRNEGDD